MKKLAILLFIPFYAHGAAWDLSIGQYDQFGTSILNRLVPRPSGGGVDGIVVYDQAANLPKLATLSGCSLSSGVLTCTGTPQVNSDWNASSGVAQILNKPTLAAVATSGAYSDLTGSPTNVSAFTNDSGYITSAALSPYATTASVTSALATKFDIPSGTTSQYIRGDGTLATYGGGTVTSITAGTGLSGGVITNSGTISMPNTGTAGTYSGVTTDAQGRVTSGTNRSFSYTTRSLNTCFQPSASRDVMVSYAVDISTTLSLSGGQTGTAYLRTYTDSGCTTGTQEITRAVNGNSGTLTIGLNITQLITGKLGGVIEAGKYVQIVTENTAGTPSFTARPGQEVTL